VTSQSNISGPDAYCTYGRDRRSKGHGRLRSPVMIAALGDRVLSIGADSADSSELRFRKRLLVGIALFILPIGFLWGCLYWVVGEEAVALTSNLGAFGRRLRHGADGARRCERQGRRGDLAARQQGRSLGLN
jgi:hypothetical protein